MEMNWPGGCICRCPTMFDAIEKELSWATSFLNTGSTELRCYSRVRTMFLNGFENDKLALRPPN